MKQGMSESISWLRSRSWYSVILIQAHSQLRTLSEAESLNLIETWQLFEWLELAKRLDLDNFLYLAEKAIGNV